MKLIQSQLYLQSAHNPLHDTSMPVWEMSNLLDAEAEVEQAVGGVRLPVGSFQLSDEATEAVAQLSSGALKNILL